MDAIFAYFANDPLKVLYILGGAGGVWFWIEKWLDRIRVRVRLLSHSFDTKPDESLEVTVEFEVVNVGKLPTSLEPYVFCSGYEIKRRYQSVQLMISEQDRLLPPHATRSFTAVGKANPTYPWWLFKAYRICPTRGQDKVMYTRSSPIKVISRLRYDLELTLYRWFGLLPFLKTSNADD